MAYDSSSPPICVHGAIVHCRIERLCGMSNFHFPCAHLMEGASLPDVHDRGTNGDNKVNTDVGVVSVGKGVNKKFSM